MRAHAKKLGKQNFFMFGEAFDGNDELMGTYTFPAATKSAHLADSIRCSTSAKNTA